MPTRVPTPAPARRRARRLGIAALGVAAAVAAGAWSAPASAEVFVDGVGAPASAADPGPDRARRQAERLDRLADARVAALQDLDARADRRAADKAEMIARLASYGFEGELTDVNLILPVSGYQLTGSYGSTGPHWATYHTGSDFAAPTGTPLLAIGAGVVTEVGDAGAYGLRTILTLPDGTELWYCHQSATYVEVGQSVEPADLVGAVGSTGNTTGPHLHLEVRPDGGDDVDPLEWLRAGGLEP